MEPLVSTSELAAIREIGVAMMTTPVEILRANRVALGDTGYDPSYPYGDSQSTYDYGDDAYYPEDELEQPDPIEAITASPTIVNVWFVSRLQAATVETDEISTVSLYIVRLPVGTDIDNHDTIRVVASGDEYFVVDTNRDDTWTEWFQVTVRRSE